MHLVYLSYLMKCIQLISKAFPAQEKKSILLLQGHKGKLTERSLWPGTNCTLLELPSKVCYRYSILMQLGGFGVLGEVISGHPCWCTLGLIIYAGCILVLVSLVHPLQIWYQPRPPSLISWGKLFSTLPPFKV